MRYELIHINGFMYAVDKEVYPIKGDTVFVHGLCKIEDDLWRKGNFIQVVEWSNYPSYLDVKISKELTWRPIRQVSKIVATNDPSLNLPLLPAVEENIEQLTKIDILHLITIVKKSTEYESVMGINLEATLLRMLKGYKAASAKQFTEEDMRKAIKLGLTLSTMTKEPFTSKTFKVLEDSTVNSFIQSLKPKPVAVKLELESELNAYYRNGVGGASLPAVDENNYVIVKQWHYEQT